MNDNGPNGSSRRIMPHEDGHRRSFPRAVMKKLPFSQVPLWWADLPLRWKGFTVVLIPVTALICGFASVYVVGLKEDDAETWVNHTSAVRYHIRKVLNAVVDAETAVRGFVISRDPQFLNLYESSRQVFPRSARELTNLVADNSAETARLNEIKELAEARLNLLSTLVGVVKTKDDATIMEQERQLIVQGKALMDKLRPKVTAMDEEETSLQEIRNRELQTARALNTKMIGLSALFGVLGGVAGMVLFSRGIVERVKKIQSNAEHLAKELTLDPMPSSNDEIGELGRRLEDASHLLSSNRQAMREGDARLQAVLDNAPSIIYVKDLDGKFILVNRAFASLLRVSKEEIIGKTGHDLYPAKEADVFQANDRVAHAAGMPVQCEEILRRKDGIHTFISSKFPLCNANGEAYALCGISTDITERKQAENELRQNKHELEAAVHTNQLIMDNSRDVICTINAAGNFLTVSAACEALWGYKREELIGRAYIDLVYPDDIPKTDQAATDIMAGRAVSDFENRYVRKDGSLVNVMWSAYWSPADNIMFCVAHDITERAQAASALAAAKAEADRASQAKSEFLSRMSHELRTPLNAILGFAQILQLDAKTNGDQESADQILRAGDHLLELINEVLDISRIEAGRLSISTEPVEVGGVIRECIQLIGPLSEQRHVDLKTSDDEACEKYVLADRQRLKQVLLNLLSNAVKYNRENGRVAISCEPAEEKTLRLKVRDTGRGMTSQDLERLFSPFERLQADRTSTEGAGLGLALSKRLVELMGGRIGVESAPRKGSLFWIELPQTEAPVQRLEHDGSAGELALREDIDSAEKTLLYIEDNLSNLRLIERIFEKQPRIKLLAAMQGGLGLDLAREHCPDLILLDVNLPDIPGAEVLRRLRGEKRTGDIPVVVVSADATARQIDRLMAAGATDYLVKPIEVKKFLRAVEKVLGPREAAPVDFE